MLSNNVRVVLSISGKGGVGKSLFALGIATALSARCRVGMLDLDIRSPNLTYVLGQDNSVVTDVRGFPEPKYVPLNGSSVPVFSSGMVYGDGKAILMSGQTVMEMVGDMIHQVMWPEIDCLVVDMDPSSTDSLRAIRALMLNVGAVIVTTSDISSLQDCRRTLDACDQWNIKVFGVVGNMVGVQCPHCLEPVQCAKCGQSVGFGEVEPILDMANEYRVPFIGALPWNPEFKSSPVQAVQSRGAKLFGKIAEVVGNA